MYIECLYAKTVCIDVIADYFTMDWRLKVENIFARNLL